MERIDVIFQVCIILGFVIPCLNLVAGFFDGLDGVANFAGNSMSFMLAIGVFGIIGKAFIGKIGIGFVLLLAVWLAAVSYLLMYYFVVRPLKKNRERVHSQRLEELVGKEGVLILQITGEHDGTVQTTDNTGAAITYRAAATLEELRKHGNCMKQGMKVEIVEVREEKQYHLCFVEKAEKQEGK